MDYLQLIYKHYPEDGALRRLLLVHSRSVTQKALQIAMLHPRLCLNLSFIEEAAMLHDIGICQTDAPGIYCHGTHPYICHGILGAAMLRAEGLERHARVCERHTGAGLSLNDIVSQGLPLPHRDFGNLGGATHLLRRQVLLQVAPGAREDPGAGTAKHRQIRGGGLEALHPLGGDVWERWL